MLTKLAIPNRGPFMKKIMFKLDFIWFLFTGFCGTSCDLMELGFDWDMNVSILQLVIWTLNPKQIPLVYTVLNNIYSL